MNLNLGKANIYTRNSTYKLQFLQNMPMVTGRGWGDLRTMFAPEGDKVAVE